MKTNFLLFTFLLFIFSCNSDKLGPFEKWSDADKVSYAIGINVANSLSAPERLNLQQIDYDKMLDGLNDATNGIDVKYSMRDSVDFWQSYIQDASNRKTEDLPVISYMIGAEVAGSFPSFFTVNPDVLMKAFVDFYEKNDLYMNDSIAVITVNDYMKAQNDLAASSNLIESEEYLQKNSQEEGVVTTTTGLQYKILNKGAGTVKPSATDQVTVHYHGTLVNGDVFDSSVDRGEPAIFGLNQVIPAWTEGVQLMSEGDKFRFFVHPDLAYRDRGTGGKIGPNVVLIFDVELISVNK